MSDEIRYERGLPRGEFFVERTARGATFYLPSPSLRPLFWAAAATAGVLALFLPIATGGNLVAREWIFLSAICLLCPVPLAIIFRQRGMRRVLEITSEGVRYMALVGRSRTDWAIAWAEVDAITIDGGRGDGALIVITGSGRRQWLNTTGLTAPQREGLVEALARAHSDGRRGVHPI